MPSKKKVRDDPFYHHEALHTTSTLLDAFHRYVTRHPFVKQDAALRRQAELVEHSICDFYQAIGQRTPKD